MVARVQQATRAPPGPQSNQDSSDRSAPASAERRQAPHKKSSRAKRLVVLSDDELAAVSLETKLSIDWRSIIMSARHGPERWQRQEIDNDFTMYTRQDSERFAVLVVGLVPGCVAEVLNVLQSPSSEQFAQRMQAIFEDELRDGAVVHRVELDGISDRQSMQACEKDDSELAELMVKRMTFNKANWLSSHEEWCYLNAVYRAKRNTVVEKIMTTLDSTDVLADAFGGGKVGSSVNAFHNVICGYLLRAGVQDPLTGQEPNNQQGDTQPSSAMSRVTRVCFYSEFQIPKRGAIEVPLASATHGWRRYVEASTKTIKRRLLKLGLSTARLTTLVRRQRLGLQAVVDSSRFLSPTQAPCKICTRMSLIAKLCRVCGHDVCSDCSAKYERARQLRGRKALEITLIRVCAHCIERIDQAEYADLVSCWLLEDLNETSPIEPRSATDTLNSLIQDALSMAVSPGRASSLKNIARAVTFREPSECSSDISSVVLTATSLDDECADPTPISRSDKHHTNKSEGSVSTVESTPMLEDDRQRLRSMRSVGGRGLATTAQLEILCDLAARELGCSTALVSVIEDDQFVVVASNTPHLQEAHIPRTETLFALVEHRAMIVSHPQTVLRFSTIDSLRELPVRFYCADPLIGLDDQVVGSMCCLHSDALEVTDVQVANFRKLAQTASRVVRAEP